MRESLLWRKLDTWMVRFVDRLGVQIVPARPLDLSGQLLHPSEAYYRANGRPVVFDVPLARMRGLGASAFPCSQDSAHPYVRSLIEYRDGAVTGYEGSALERFYSEFQPTTVADYLGFKPCERDRSASLPSHAAILPWESTTPQAREASVRHAVSQEQAKRRRAGHELSVGDWHLFGPMSPDAGRYAWDRLVDSFHSIDQQGYVRSNRVDGDIRGQVLLDERDPESWCFWVWGGGQHRSAALGALGHESAPVRFLRNRVPLILRTHARYWPQVVDGSITVESALCVFDRMVEGRQPAMGSSSER